MKKQQVFVQSCLSDRSLFEPLRLRSLVLQMESVRGLLQNRCNFTCRRNRLLEFRQVSDGMSQQADFLIVKDGSIWSRTQPCTQANAVPRFPPNLHTKTTGSGFYVSVASRIQWMYFREVGNRRELPLIEEDSTARETFNSLKLSYFHLVGNKTILI